MQPGILAFSSVLKDTINFQVIDKPIMDCCMEKENVGGLFFICLVETIGNLKINVQKQMYCTQKRCSNPQVHTMSPWHINVGALLFYPCNRWFNSKGDSSEGDISTSHHYFFDLARNVSITVRHPGTSNNTVLAPAEIILLS